MAGIIQILSLLFLFLSIFLFLVLIKAIIYIYGFKKIPEHQRGNIYIIGILDFFISIFLSFYVLVRIPLHAEMDILIYSLIFTTLMLLVFYLLLKKI